MLAKKKDFEELQSNHGFSGSMDELETIVQKITGCPSAFDQIEHERKASPNFSFMISMALSKILVSIISSFIKILEKLLEKVNGYVDIF